MKIEEKLCMFRKFFEKVNCNKKYRFAMLNEEEVFEEIVDHIQAQSEHIADKERGEAEAMAVVESQDLKLKAQEQEITQVRTAAKLGLIVINTHEQEITDLKAEIVYMKDEKVNQVLMSNLIIKEQEAEIAWLTRALEITEARAHQAVKQWKDIGLLDRKCGLDMFIVGSTPVDQAKAEIAKESENEEQRRSFAHGNTNLDNPNITREMIDDAADRLEATNGTD